MPGGAPGKLGWQASDAGAGREPVKRTELTPKQLAALMAQFKADRLPSSETRAKLAKELGMSTRSVQIWFQNRRQRDPNRVRKPQHKPVLGRLVRPSHPPWPSREKQGAQGRQGSLDPFTDLFLTHFPDLYRLVSEDPFTDLLR